MSTIQDKNKLVQYTTEINREYVRENLFSPYMGTDATSIIRLRNEAKKGGEQINFPLVGALYGPGTPQTLGLPTRAYSTDTLTGFEEQIDNYGMRVWIDWARNAVATNDAEEQKDSADIFGEAKPLLSDWGKSLQRDEIILAMMNLPTETAPTTGGLAFTNARVNGIAFQSTAGAAAITTWISQNADRVLFGNAISNTYSAGTTPDTWPLARAKVDTTADTFVPLSVSLLKYRAKTAVPKIRPYTTRDGREYFVAFAGTANFVQLKTAMNSVGTAGTVSGINLYARPREENGYGDAPNNHHPGGSRDRQLRYASLAIGCRWRWQYAHCSGVSVWPASGDVRLGKNGYADVPRSDRLSICSRCWCKNVLRVGKNFPHSEADLQHSWH
jgi:hypothetical protein